MTDPHPVDLHAVEASGARPIARVARLPAALPASVWVHPNQTSGTACNHRQVGVRIGLD
jgi:hypothetical protein